MPAASSAVTPSVTSRLAPLNVTTEEAATQVTAPSASAEIQPACT